MLNRRHLLAGTAATLAAPLYINRVLANPYARFSGQTVVVNFPAHPHFDAATKALPEFTAQTGIKVEVDKLQYLRMRDKQLLEMSKPGNGDYDLLAYVVFWKSEYANRKLIREVGSMFKDEKLAVAGYDFNDLITGYVENIGLVGGKKGYLAGANAKLYGVPFGSETSVLGYRKDIFEKHKLEAPKTYAELDALLTKIGQVESARMVASSCPNGRADF
jgi:multiple sugar transport system substrate-binding protein